MAATHLLLLENISQLVTVCDSSQPFKAGKDQDTVSVLCDASVVVGLDGRIAAVGSSSEIEAQFASSVFERTVDGSGCCVIPGFCDAHTHMLWAGDRVHEFCMKLAGATYMDIHKAGGGIGFTVDHVRRASEEELEQGLVERLDRILRFGTTLVEAKSGYGLDTESEMKMLRVLHRVNQTHAVDIVSTFCGAHSVPKGRTAEEYTVEVVDEQIPRLIQLREEGLVSPSMIDVFFEKDIFTWDQTRRILEAGRLSAGLEANFHGDELHAVNVHHTRFKAHASQAGELAGELGALAVSHCEMVTASGIKAMAQRPSVAVLLPTTAYVLRLEPPPARDMINGGAFK